jgi:hypothetical protein
MGHYIGPSEKCSRCGLRIESSLWNMNTFISPSQSIESRRLIIDQDWVGTRKCDRLNFTSDDRSIECSFVPEAKEATLGEWCQRRRHEEKRSQRM